MIPKHLRALFWEVNAETVDLHQYCDYVIGRILDRGTEEAVSWMRATFRTDEITKVIREDRRLSPKSATYWALLYDIPTEQVAALSHQPASL